MSLLQTHMSNERMCYQIRHKCHNLLKFCVPITTYMSKLSDNGFYVVDMDINVQRKYNERICH